TYSPDSGVVLGVGGPVTNLGCGNGGVYDWSTGLIFRNGRYFDPNTGIWITMGAMVTWQIWPKENRQQRRWRRKYGQQATFLILLLLLILMATALSGCGCGIVPTIPDTSTPPPTLPPIDDTPTPGQPETPTPTPGQPDTPTPQPPPTDTPQPPSPQLPTPSEPPIPVPTDPPIPTPTPTPPVTSVPPDTSDIWSDYPVRTEAGGKKPYWIQWYGYTGWAKAQYPPYNNADGIHPGLDFGPARVTQEEFQSHDPNNPDPTGTPVYASTSGDILRAENDTRGHRRVIISLNDGSFGYYDHLEHERGSGHVEPDDIIGYLEKEEQHVHLERRVNNRPTNPLPFFEAITRNEIVNWPRGPRTTYPEHYWQGNWWRDPLLQPDSPF
ncbi:MAG: M23 family metallopeptidase, partial [Chloroflexi bacterium]|nr:M23 family metallopeptidase [Chloroflexota bacterium]